MNIEGNAKLTRIRGGVGNVSYVESNEIASNWA